MKTLIDLCPGIRLPQHEEEIFSDKDLTEYYLRKLCEQYDWCGRGDSAQPMVYRYAKYVMKCRWPEAEHIIATNPAYVYHYAMYVMKSPWPEAEPVIAANRYYSVSYNNAFGTSL